CIDARPRGTNEFKRDLFRREKYFQRLQSGIMTPRMVANRDLCAPQVGGFGNVRVARNDNGCFAHAVSLSPHNAFLNLCRLVYSPMTRTADIAGAFALTSMSFGVTLKRAKAVVFERNLQIHGGESRRVFAAPFYIELVV